MTVYCAPATRPLLVLHVAEPGADLRAAAGMEGLTVCGLVMAGGEFWLPIKRLPGDPVCWACSGADGPDGVQLELALVP